MFLFERASGIIVGTVFLNYIMSVSLGTDLGIVFGAKDIEAETPHT